MASPLQSCPSCHARLPAARDRQAAVLRCPACFAELPASLPGKEEPRTGQELPLTANPDSGQHLLERLNAGEEQARDELLARTCGRLQRLAHQMLRDYPRVKRWEDSDDVLQNALIRLLRALAAVKISTAKDFYSLAALQIRRELLDLARRIGGPRGIGTHHASGAMAGAGPSSAAPETDPSTSTLDPAKLAQWTEFHAQVDSLPAEEREVFDLIWYQELTHAEAAALLNVAEITVKRRWLKARLHLQALLERRSSSG